MSPGKCGARTVHRRGVVRGALRARLVRAVCARLQRREVRRGAGEARVHVHLALKKLPRQNQLPVVDAVRNGAAHRHFAQGGGQLRQEIANLVGVREKHDGRLRLLEKLPQRDGVSIRRVVLEQRVLHRVDFLEMPRRQLSGKVADGLPQNGGAGGSVEFRRELAGRGKVSKDSRFHAPPRCSITARMLI